MTQYNDFSDFTDITGLFDVPRLVELALSPDGSRLVAAVQQPDQHGAKYVSSLWELDPAGRAAAERITFSVKGESAPRFAPDGTLLFTSARPDPTDDDKGNGKHAIWRLPAHGEAKVVADAAGGLSVLGVAADGTILARTAVLAGGALADDAEHRKARKDGGVTAILHTGMPVRAWDHETGDTSTRLVLVTPGDEPIDLTPGADAVALLDAAADITPDGRHAVTTWNQRSRGGDLATSIAVIDTKTHRRRFLLRGKTNFAYTGPVISPDGGTVALVRSTDATFTDTHYDFLELHPLTGGEPVVAKVGDLTVGEYCWAPDGRTLYVTGDLHSRGAILAVDAATGQSRVLADDGSYSSVQLTPDGKQLYALRATIDSPRRVVRLATGRRGPATRIPAPGGVSDLPGTLDWVTTTVDDVEIGGWLCTPKGASSKRPAPVMLWIHGGPHASYNAWSWRWCPWTAVARGWAVLMPDPAMSTGYGHAGLNRGWPRLADVVWREVEGLLDHVLRRKTLDANKTALLGASFGGYMTNWLAGHTDRFGAIVTHAGLYALDQQHGTSDLAPHKTKVHGRIEERPQWYATYSPHAHIEKFSTPMLITHGTKDFRVPVSEALRLWWDLVSRWAGRPEDLPHRFLQFTSENHWILGPNNSRVWVRSVLGFCEQHVLGADPLPDTVIAP